jgi:hypothetical protein
MAIDIMQTLEVIEVMENFIAKKRPPEHIRHQWDLNYKIEDQSVVIFEIRPRWDRPELKMEPNISKATFIKAKNHWKVFWQRSDLKWHSYQPKPEVKSLNEFIKLVEEDKHGCFWG